MLNYLWLQHRKHINSIFGRISQINFVDAYIGMENDLLFIKQQLAEKEKQVQEYQMNLEAKRKQAQASGK